MIKTADGFLLIIMCFSVFGCAHGPSLGIQSDVPARIEKNGVEACESTPCIITGNYYKDGYGMGCVRGDDTRLEAFPLDPKTGYKQSKVVSGGCSQELDVFFDMNSGGAVNTIVHDDSSKGQDSATLEKKLTDLQRMKKKGLINAEEFNSKKKELLDSFK